MEENYILAKKIVNEKFPDGSGIDGFFILGLYGLLSIYGNHKDIVSKAFLNTDILFEHGTIKEILNRNNIDLQEFKYDERAESSEMATYAVSNLGNYICLEDGQLKLENDKPFIAASIDHVGITRLLNSFIHEMGHIIKGYVNGYSIKEDKDKVFAYVRSGLQVDGIKFEKKSSEYYNYRIMEVLDEVINTVQTTEALQEIKALDGTIPDKDVQDFFNMFNKNLLDEDYGYKKTVKAFRPLWESKSFKKVIEDNIIEGKISRIKNYFDSRTYKGAFTDLGDLLDDLDEVDSIGGDFIIEFVTNMKIRSIISKYKRNKSYQKKK